MQMLREKNPHFPQFLHVDMTLPPGKQATIIICFIKKKLRRREIYCKFGSKDESNKTVDDITGQYNGKTD